MNLQKLTPLILYSMLLICDVTSKMHIKIVKNKFSTLSKITRQIFKSCKKDYKTIVINEYVDERVIKHFSGLDNIAVILQGRSSKIECNCTRRNRVDSFIATIDNSVDELDGILSNLKNSLWWNILRPHFILSNLENGCKVANVALKKVWIEHILNCYYICFNSQGRPFVYTFNPYSRRAPYQWRIFSEIRSRSHYMAIYKRIYDKDICKGFDFDRTKYLDKAVVKMILSRQNFKDSPHGSRLVKTIKTVFNVTSVLNVSQGICNIWSKYSQRKKTDIVLCPKNYNEYGKVQISYPTSLDGLYIFSNNQRYFSPLEKIYSAFDPSLILGTTIISIIIYLVILITNSSRSHSFATFEILRLWTSNSLNTKMDSQPLRVFFSSVFIYFFIMQATLQGDLIEFLSKTELRKNANFLTDLRSDYYQKIFTSEQDLMILESENLIMSKIKYTTDPDACIKAVIEDKSSACIEYYQNILFWLSRTGLSNKNVNLRNYHLSKYPINTLSRGFFSREDWPLRGKFDNFLMTLENSGINDKIKADTSALIGHDLQTVHYIPSFQSISFDSLSFIFYIWSIGIMFSVISFFFERFRVGKLMSRNDKVMVFERRNKQKMMSNYIRVVDSRIS